MSQSGRVFSGRIFADAHPEAGRRRGPRVGSSGVAFYESALEFDERLTSQAQQVWDLGSAEAAELAKLAETTYRDVNIGLANQFAQFRTRSRRRDGGDRACNTQPYSPSTALGSQWAGTASIYPQFYIFNDPADDSIAARSANKAMPPYAVDLLKRQWGISAATMLSCSERRIEAG